MNFEDKGLDIGNDRVSEADVDEIFLKRWSPRAFDAESIPDDALNSLFEAARWAPSCFNEQPWLFVYGSSEEERDVFLSILAEKNQLWAKKAPILAVLFAKRAFAMNSKPNRWAAFDCGAAWMSLTVQARLLGLYTHGMAGFSQEKAYNLLGVPEDEFEAMCAIAIGKYGDPAELDEDFRAMEAPNERKPLSQAAVRLAGA